jgi:hypothetical protein
MSPATGSLQNRRRRKGVPLLGAAGLSLSLSGGAPAAVGIVTADMPECLVGATHEQTLREEEVTDITLSRFDISERKTVPWVRMRIAGGGACGGCGAGLYSNPPMYNDTAGSPVPPARKPTHQSLQRPRAPSDRIQRTSRPRSPDAGGLTSNQNAPRPTEPESGGVVINQSAGQSTQSQAGSPVTNTGN